MSYTDVMHKFVYLQSKERKAEQDGQAKPQPLFRSLRCMACTANTLNKLVVSKSKVAKRDERQVKQFLWPSGRSRLVPSA